MLGKLRLSLANQDGWSAYVYESRKHIYESGSEVCPNGNTWAGSLSVKSVLLQFYNIESKNYNILELNKNVETVIIY